MLLSCQGRYGLQVVYYKVHAIIKNGNKNNTMYMYFKHVNPIIAT